LSSPAAALRKAQTIRPLATYISTNIAIVLYYGQRYQEALAQLELILRMDAVLADHEEAIDWPEQSVAAHTLGLFSVDPNFWPLHGHPRFRALVDRLGFRMVGPLA
jgi:hypothetical protein